MDSGPSPSGKKKLRFAPKPRKAPQPVASDICGEAEKEDDDQETLASLKLNRKFQEHLRRQSLREERKSPAKDAFTHEGGSCSTIAIRNFGEQTEKTGHGSAAASSFKLLGDDSTALVPSVPTDEVHEVDVNAESSSDDEKEEIEDPWDKENSYYPTTLPWTKPSSGNPAALDKEKFDEDAEIEEKSHASVLGLLDEDDKKTRMIFLQFPPTLPFVGNAICATKSAADGYLKDFENLDTNRNQLAGKSLVAPLPDLKGKAIAGSSPRFSNFHPAAKGKETAGRFTASTTRNTLAGGRMEEMPEGFMGKMLVYKSGAVKLKLGDTLFDVSPGIEISSPQTFMAIDTINKVCTALGDLDNRAVVSLNIDSS